MTQQTYRGIWPVAPTPFNDDGSIDFTGMTRVLDCMIDQGVDGICILANYSEQFVLSDDERASLTKLCLEHINDRVPTIVTISHFSTDIVVERARFAKTLGADILMIMPPYHGALMQASDQQTYEQFSRVGDVGVPIMVQDAPLSGINLNVELLVRMAKEIEMVKLFKIECAFAADKLAKLIKQGGSAIEGPFDGEEAITLLADLHAGATGNMCSALIPELVGTVVRQFHDGDIDQATQNYNKIVPVLNHENRQCGFRAAKTALMSGGVIKSDFCRHPTAPLGDRTKQQLLTLLRPLSPISLNWGL